jgi:hypothetical protein
MRAASLQKRRQSDLTIVVTIVLLAVAQLGVAMAKTIFDDDWVPPSRTVSPPATAPLTPVPPAASQPASVRQRTTSKPPTAVNPLPELPGVRRPIPPKADLERSRVVLREAFAAQLADPGIPARRKLAETLLIEAAKAGDNAADQFVLLGGAMGAAKEGASLRLVCRTADEMASAYDVDAAQAKLAAALSMPLKADCAANNVENASAGLELIDSLLNDDDVTTAGRLCTLLRPLAASDRSLAETVLHRSMEIDQRRAAQDRIRLPLDHLKTTPDDPAANLAVGSYVCFWTDRWTKGLPMLAKGSDPDMKKLAADDLAQPTDAATLLRLGDQWWNIAAKQLPQPQANIHRHAAALYAACGSGVSPLERIKIEKRLAEAGIELPTAATTVSVTDPRAIGKVPPSSAKRTAPMEPVSVKPAANEKWVFLMQLQEAEVQAINIREWATAKVMFDGAVSPHGFYLHPPSHGSSHVTYDLKDGDRYFKTGVAIADEVGKGSWSNLTFKVIGDGKTLWESEPMKQTRHMQTCGITIAWVKKLTLWVDCPGRYEFAHAIWIEPQILTSGDIETRKRQPVPEVPPIR